MNNIKIIEKKNNSNYKVCLGAYEKKNNNSNKYLSKGDNNNKSYGKNKTNCT